jgi:glycosyltransferase involved in cell wall biosynthesis
MMKILYVSAHPHLNLSAPSGPGTHMREVINAFRKEGHEVDTLIAGGEVLVDTHAQIKFKQRVWKRFIPKLIWNTLKELQLLVHNEKFKAQVQGAILKYQPDLIYERGYAFMTATSDIARRNGIPFFIELNAPYPEEFRIMSGTGLLTRFLERGERKQVFSADQLIVVSSAMQDYLLKKYGIDKTKILITPNAVSESFLEINEDLRKELKARFSGFHVIGFVGSIFPYHGVDKLIKAFYKLQSDQSDVRCKLLVVGDGEVLGDLKQMTADLGILHLVEFTGNIPHKDVSTYISIMNVAVMADSNWYGSPVKIFEYGIFGKYIIAPNTSPVRDVMTNKIHGWLLERDEQDLFEALKFSTLNSNECIIVGSRFKEVVINNHLWLNVGKNILSRVR